MTQEREGISMANWATVSLREELVEEVRKNLKTGHYRSISEFVSEAIRLRLEEISSGKHDENPIRKTSTITVPRKIADVEKHPDIMVDRLEQIWTVLVRFFEDLTRKKLNVGIEIASELRNCRTLINFIRAHSCPGCNREIAEDKLKDLEDSLGKIKDDLIVVALGVSENYAKEWVNKIDEAERGDLDIVTSTVSNFIPGLPKDPETGWIRLTLSKPIAKERVQEISRQFNVVTEYDSGSQLIVRGDKASVKKAVRALHRLQLD